MTPRHITPSKRWRIAAALSLGLAAVPMTWSQDDEEEDIIELSPFEVDASNDQGYYSERTLAGSRIDTPLADIAASISIVNREQLEDTAATDINDVFLYDINTESADTYTPTVTSFRAGLRDSNAGFSAANTGGLSDYSGSNRIRGLASPDNSRNFYRSISQIGFDAYNTRSIEINRGPNSLLFGQGSPAGIVNQNTATAFTDLTQTEIQFRLGQYGSYRAHFNHNQPIIEDTLGIYIAGLYDSEGFRRKPSYDIERRIYGAITYTPNNRINVQANYEKYDNSQSRPNSLMPIDAITPWIEAGRPSYDPYTRTITNMDTGAVYGPFAFSTSSPHYVGDGQYANGNAVYQELLADGSANPWYTPGVYFSGGRFVTMINDRSDYFSVDTRVAGVNMNGQNPVYTESLPAVDVRTSGQWAMYDRNWLHSDTYRNPGTSTNWQPYTLNASHKDIYDWTRYNTNSPNYGEFDGDTFNVELDAKIFDWWFVKAGYFNQQANSEENFTLGQLNANRMFVEVNTNLIDGSPNPFYGQPYMEDSQPDTFEHSWDTTTYRLQSVMTMDMSDRDDIFRWLGKQNLIAIASREEWNTGSKRLRAMVSDSSNPTYMPNRDYNTPADGWRWWVRGARVIRQYYMGEAGSPGKVTHSANPFGQPSYGGPTTDNVLHFNWNTMAWENPSISWANYLSEATTYLQESTTDSITLAWNASLIGDRLVPTIGYRHDNIENRATTTGGLSVADFVSDTDAGVVMLDTLYSNWNPAQVYHGNTWTYGATFDILRTDEHEVSIFYNESENFNPPDGVYVDYYGDRLPKPQGEGTDYGFSVGLWNNKFTARVTWFENSNSNAISSTGTSAANRVIYMDNWLMMGWAEMIARMELGQQPFFTDDESLLEEGTDPYEMIESLDPSITSRIEEITGLPYDYFSTLGGSIRAIEDNTAEGLEISMTWNPTPNWTFRANIAKQETTFSNVAPKLDQWLEDRMAVWTSASSPLSSDLNVWEEWGSESNRQVNLTNFWDAYGYKFYQNGSRITIENADDTYHSTANYYHGVVEGLINIYKAQQGAPSATQRKWRGNMIGRYTFTEGALKGSFIGGGFRYESKVAIGYYGIDADGNGVLDSPDLDRPIWDDANYYFDVWTGYRTKIMDDRADLLVQLNIRNIFEDGDLRPIGADFDGNKHTWRIIEPREIYVTTTIKF